MVTLIKNGTLVTATDTFVADLWIEGSRIVRISDASERALRPPGEVREIDATGHYVFPGGIDAHTHLDMPFGGTTSSDDFETGVKGGNVTPTGWTVSDGSVDVVYPGWFGGLCLSSGRCVDLDGSTGNAGVLSQSLNLNAGWTYTLSFDIAGNRRNAGSETVLVSFGSASSTLMARPARTTRSAASKVATTTR